MSKNISLVIGNYQPLDKHDAEVLKRAYANGEYLIVMIGSVNRSRTYLSPFSYIERKDMVERFLKSEGMDHCVDIMPLNDHLYNESQWLHEVNSKVDDVLKRLGVVEANVTLYALNRKESGFYKEKFPQYNVTSLKTSESTESILYDIYNEPLGRVIHSGRAPDSTWDFVVDWAASERFRVFKDEHDFVEGYKQQWSSAPYEPVFFTTDAVVYYKGHVLLTRRQSNPGMGMYGLPGGFINPHKTTKESMLDNLKKDTNIEVGRSILKSNIMNARLFDHPKRSTRGRIITEASLIVLDDVTSIKTFPKTKKSTRGEDKTFWAPVNRLDSMATNMFEDHYFIIKCMLNSVMF